MNTAINTSSAKQTRAPAKGSSSAVGQKQDDIVKVVTFDGDDKEYRDLNKRMRTYQPNK